MSSDDAYMSFLNKANADLSAGQQQQPQSQGTSSARTQTVDAKNQNQIPASLQSIDAFYVSETDEPFEPVVLGWEGAKEGVWPSHCMFFIFYSEPDILLNECLLTLMIAKKAHLSSLISETDLSSSITTLSSTSFDPRDEYAGVLRAVKEAASGGAGAGKESAVEVKVYRVEIGRSRVEYFVLGLDGDKGRVVGFKASAVET